MQGTKIRQVNNIIITQVSRQGFVAWSPDGDILDVSRNCDELVYLSSQTKTYLKRNGYKKKIRALVDVDNTLADHSNAMRLFLADHDISYYPQRLTEYHGIGMTPDIIGCSWEIVRSAMKQPLAYTGKYFRLYPGVHNALVQLRSFAETNGYTGAENVKEIYNKRLRFCNEMNLGNKNVIIGSKEVRAGFDVLFDDNPYVVKKWIDSVTPTKIFVITQPYNVNINFNSDKVIRCKNFPDAVAKCSTWYNTVYQA